MPPSNSLGARVLIKSAIADCRTRRCGPRPFCWGRQSDGDLTTASPPAEKATGHLIRLVRLRYAAHVPVARGRFAYEHLRPAISYSRGRTTRTPSAGPSRSNFPPCHLTSGLGLIGRPYQPFPSSPPQSYTHRLSLTATSLQRVAFLMGHSCFQVAQESWRSPVGEPHDCGRSCLSP
jgi:hypothetical protein